MRSLAIIVLTVVSAISNYSYAQNGMRIAGATGVADVSAMVDVISTTKGFLTPRMTNAQRGAIATPATGLLIFQTDGTAGYYYNSGTPGAPVWTQIIPSITGTGTPPNAVARWTGAYTLANSIISDNGTNVGINSATPGAKLDIGGTPASAFRTATFNISANNGSTTDRNYFRGGVDHLVIAGRTTGASTMYYSYTGDLTVGSTTNTRIQETLFIPATTSAGNGNVGIGSATPASKLDVVGKTQTDQLQVDNIPAFCADMNADMAVNQTAAKEVTGWRVTGLNNLFNSNSNFDIATGRFTAPRNGYYFFSAQCRFDGVSSDYIRLQICVNGSVDANNGMHSIAQFGVVNNLYYSPRVSGIIKLTAGEYVSVWTTSQVDATYSIQNESGFTGFLVSEY